MNSTNIRPLLGLLGVFEAALSADYEFVSAAALVDVRGALGIDVAIMERVCQIG